MSDISNWLGLLAGIITSSTTVIAAISKLLDKKLKGLYDNDRLQLRYEICDFAGDLRNGIPKIRGEYQAIFELIDRYKKLVKKLNVENNYINNEIAFIEKKYQELN